MFSAPEVAVILVVVLIIFGPGKLPDLGSALGKGLKGFRKATQEEEQPLEKVSATEPQRLPSAKPEPGGTKPACPQDGAGGFHG